MARVKVGVTAHARHKKILKMAKGYRGARHAQFKKANARTLIPVLTLPFVYPFFFLPQVFCSHSANYCFFTPADNTPYSTVPQIEYHCAVS